MAFPSPHRDTAVPQHRRSAIIGPDDISALAAEHGVPTVAATIGPTTLARAQAFAEEHGTVMIKASADRGARGMRAVTDPAGLPAASGAAISTSSGWRCKRAISRFEWRRRHCGAALDRARYQRAALKSRGFSAAAKLTCTATSSRIRGSRDRSPKAVTHGVRRSGLCDTTTDRPDKRKIAAENAFFTKTVARSFRPASKRADTCTA